MIHMHAAPTPPKLLKFKHPSAKYRRKKRTLCRDRNAAFGGSPCARCRHILEALAGLTPAASRIDKSSNLEHVSVLALHGLHPWPTSPEPKGTRRLGPSKRVVRCPGRAPTNIEFCRSRLRQIAAPPTLGYFIYHFTGIQETAL